MLINEFLANPTIPMIGFILGVLVGWLVSKLDIKYDGIFHINTSDPNKDVFRLEVGIPIGSIYGKKYIVFKVKKDS